MPRLWTWCIQKPVDAGICLLIAAIVIAIIGPPHHTGRQEAWEAPVRLTCEAISAILGIIGLGMILAQARRAVPLWRVYRRLAEGLRAGTRSVADPPEPARWMLRSVRFGFFLLLLGAAAAIVGFIGDKVAGGDVWPSVVVWFGAIMFPGAALILWPVGVLWAWDHRASSRLAAGLCPACGYDLRASTDRCPECGRPITRD